MLVFLLICKVSPVPSVFAVVGVCQGNSWFDTSLPLLQSLGFAPDLVRLSIGIEDWRDLLEDLGQALQEATRKANL